MISNSAQGGYQEINQKIEIQKNRLTIAPKYPCLKKAEVKIKVSAPKINAKRVHFMPLIGFSIIRLPP